MIARTYFTQFTFHGRRLPFAQVRCPARGRLGTGL